MAELIAFFSRRDENYVNGMLKKAGYWKYGSSCPYHSGVDRRELFQIEQMQAYSKDYNECIAQARADQKRDARPELKTWPVSLGPYDVVYLGYPNYWGTMPMAVFTFLEHLDFSGRDHRRSYHGGRQGGKPLGISENCAPAQGWRRGFLSGEEVPAG